MNIAEIKSRVNKLFEIAHNGCKYPTPMFFRGDGPDLETLIKEKQENYRRQGYSPKAIAVTPVFIEGELAG
jgi:hypothetical protein